MKKMMPMMVIMLIIVVAAFVYGWQGVSMHTQVDSEEAAFHQLIDDYFSQSKSVRDAAPGSSELTDQLVELQQYPSDLLRLKLVGVGKILTGIFILLFGILIALVSMPIRLSKLMKK